MGVDFTGNAFLHLGIEKHEVAFLQVAQWCLSSYGKIHANWNWIPISAALWCIMSLRCQHPVFLQAWIYALQTSPPRCQHPVFRPGRQSLKRQHPKIRSHSAPVRAYKN